MLQKFILAVFVFAGLVFAADFSVRPYREPDSVRDYVARRDSAGDQKSRAALAQEFQALLPDEIPLQILVSNDLAISNLDRTREFYVKRAEAEPKNISALYLAGRLMESPPERQSYAERILDLEPENYWGLLLLGSSMMTADDAQSGAAESHFLKAIAKNNSLPFAVSSLAELYVRQSKFDKADEVYAKLAEMQPERFEPLRFRLMLHPGETETVLKWIDEFLKRNPRNVDAMNTRAAVLREQADWKGYLETNRRIVRTALTGETAYNLACAFSLAGEPDSAFAWLFAASDLHYGDMNFYREDEDLTPLRADPRWTELLERIEANEQKALQSYMQEIAANAQQQQQKAVTERGGEMAADFTFADLEGKSVTLSKLRGKVVILDFWATWCGPCRKTMPLLQQYYSETRPPEVEVFGVNVWERNPGGVKPFIESNGFKFPILLGDNAVAEKYGVRGIPTLVVIDKDGKVAYRHVGYNPGMIQQLIWQTGELLKQP